LSEFPAEEQDHEPIMVSQKTSSIGKEVVKDGITWEEEADCNSQRRR
jgi:hypothetical protein